MGRRAVRNGFGRALDECLESLRRGAGDIDVLLARHARHAERLRPILEAALRLGGEPPPAQDKARGKARLYAVLHEQRESRKPLRIGVLPFTWATRGGLMVAAGFLALVAAVGGTAAASSSVRDVIVPSPMQALFGAHDHSIRERGIISEISDGSFIIRNQEGTRNVRVSEATRVLDRGTPAPDTALVPGQQVRVAGESEDDESVNAAQVDIEQPPPPPPPTATATAAPPAETPDRRDKIHLTGDIVSVGENLLVVSARGRTWQVRLNALTTVNGQPATGARVQVEGWALDDGAIAADQVEVQSPVSNKPSFAPSIATPSMATPMPANTPPEDGED